MNRPRPEPVPKVRLRAACDRCHDLKNRCIRTGGLESRCERCERLDIDCVYRNSSSMGRPRRQRKAPGAPARHYGQAAADPPVPSEPAPEISATAVGDHELDAGQMEADTVQSGSATLTDLQWDATSFLVSPEGPWLSEQYWGADFCSPNATTIHDPLSRYQEAHQSPHAEQHAGRPENSGGCYKASAGADCNPKEQRTTLITQLFHLQEQLCRLLSAGDAQPGPEYVQEGLEASKSLLDMLQAGTASRSSIAAAPAVSSGDRRTSAGEPIPPERSQSPHSLSGGAPSREGRPDPLHISYILLQQTVTCYLCVLLLLDRVVGVLTSRGGLGDVDVWVSQECPPALHLGLFSLDSQPALNNEIVLYLILRLVQQLQAIIHRLASECRELVGDPHPTSTSAGPDRESPGGSKTSPISLDMVSHAMSDLVIKRERSLVGRLSALTGALRNR